MEAAIPTLIICISCLIGLGLILLTATKMFESIHTSKQIKLSHEHDEKYKQLENDLVEVKSKLTGLQMNSGIRKR